MTAALKIPENYAEELPKTIAELKAQQEYFNQLEIAAKKIQEATQNYNRLLEQGLSAIPANNIDYNWENVKTSENNYQKEIEENINQETSEEIKQISEEEQVSEEEEQTETEEYPQYNETKNEENLEDEDSNENFKEEENENENKNDNENQVQWPKINLNSLLHKDNNEE